MSTETQGKRREYLETFVRSASAVLRSELKIDFKQRSLNIKHNPKLGYPLSIVIGFVSDILSGQAVYSMTRDFGMSIARTLLPEMLPSHHKEMLGGVIGEIANMISGRATVKLAGENDKILITPPVIIENEKESHDVNFLEVPTVSFLLDSTLGSTEINIAFQEGV